MAVKEWSCEKDILCGINEPKDLGNMEDLEKKHYPVINAPSEVEKDSVFDVEVKIGGIDGVEHPNEAAHFIEWLELYSGDTFLGRASFSGGSAYGSACFRVQLDHSHGPLKVRSKCNIHGLWEGTKEIKIKG